MTKETVRHLLRALFVEDNGQKLVKCAWSWPASSWAE
jgi:hypothetical protein